MNLLMLIILLFFWVMLLFYSILTIAGVVQRLTKKKTVTLTSYPSIAVLIPAHNEDVVIKDTLHALVK